MPTLTNRIFKYSIFKRIILSTYQYYRAFKANRPLTNKTSRLGDYINKVFYLIKRLDGMEVRFCKGRLF